MGTFVLLVLSGTDEVRLVKTLEERTEVCVEGRDRVLEEAMLLSCEDATCATLEDLVEATLCFAEEIWLEVVELSEREAVFSLEDVTGVGEDSSEELKLDWLDRLC